MLIFRFTSVCTSGCTCVHAAEQHKMAKVNKFILTLFKTKSCVAHIDTTVYTIRSNSVSMRVIFLMYSTSTTCLEEEMAAVNRRKPPKAVWKCGASSVALVCGMTFIIIILVALCSRILRKWLGVPHSFSAVNCYNKFKIVIPVSIFGGIWREAGVGNSTSVVWLVN